TIANDGTLAWAGWFLDLYAGARIENAGTFEISSNEWIQDVSGTGTDPRIVNEGLIRKTSTGTTSFDAVVHNEGTVAVEAGSLRFLRRSPSYLRGKRLLAEGTYELKGRLALANADVLTNAARILLDGTAAAFTDLSGSNALRNLNRNTAAGRIELRNGAALGTTGPVTNLGKITVGPSSTLTTAGRYLQTAGATVLDAATSKIVPTGAAVELRKGSLRGTGTVQGDLRNTGGVVMPGAADPGTLTVTGAFTQGSTGLLVTDIVSSSAADKLTVVGPAALGGTLQTTAARTYAPVVDERFRLVGSASTTGSFDSVTGQRLTGGNLLWIEQQTDGVDAVVRVDDGGQWATVAIDGGADVTNSPTLTLTITPDPARTITGMRIASDAVPSGPFQPFATSVPWTLSPGDGTRRVYVELRDGAGNRSAVLVDSIVLDTRAPTVDIAAPLDAASPVTFTFSEPVTRARAGNVFVADASGIRVPATLACLAADGTPVSCSDDLYQRVDLTFDSDPPPGEYVATVNPATAAVHVADRASNAVATTTKSFGI
ncbi:MAG TPA: hypothetical protein VHI71_08750, partial [Actinomycetota bacterium]|nr:hypothetical protein [Actinomycetota bacterium]